MVEADFTTITFGENQRNFAINVVLYNFLQRVIPDSENPVLLKARELYNKEKLQRRYKKC